MMACNENQTTFERIISNLFSGIRDNFADILLSIVVFMLISFMFTLALLSAFCSDSIGTSAYIQRCNMSNIGIAYKLYEEIPWRLNREIAHYNTLEEANVALEKHLELMTKMRNIRDKNE